MIIIKAYTTRVCAHHTWCIGVAVDRRPQSSPPRCKWPPCVECAMAAGTFEGYFTACCACTWHFSDDKKVGYFLFFRHHAVEGNISSWRRKIQNESTVINLETFPYRGARWRTSIFGRKRGLYWATKVRELTCNDTIDVRFQAIQNPTIRLVTNWGQDIQSFEGNKVFYPTDRLLWAVGCRRVRYLAVCTM